jgi:hypothetical protein
MNDKKRNIILATIGVALAGITTAAIKLLPKIKEKCAGSQKQCCDKMKDKCCK